MGHWHQPLLGAGSSDKPGPKGCDQVRVDIDGRKIGGDRSLCGDDRGETRLEIGRRNAEDSFEYRVTRRGASRSEEHTSELQSLMRISYAVFCLKKKIQ